MRRKSAQELEMGFNPINLDNIFEEEDPLSAWIEEREDPVLDSEHNFSWLPEELLNETDEETQGEDIDDISHEESVQLSTSSSGGGGGDGGGGGGGGGSGGGRGGDDDDDDEEEEDEDEDEVFRYSSVAGPGLFETNRRDGGDRTHGRMRERFHDSFAGSSSHNLAANDYEISESSEGSHSYQPTAHYPPYLEQYPNYGLFDYRLPYQTFPINDAPYDTQNVMPFSHGMESDQNQGTDETGDALDAARHSFWCDEAVEGYSFIFKGNNVAELTQKLMEETGMEDAVVCTRSPLNGKLYPLRLQLPPNNADMHVVVVPLASKVARNFAN
ncbi:hypothetical protein V6N11_075007 [Hibiscus sabdariffa]|uniref:DUF569 domain-containing protein n=1 Tax=Hibiscus sabdariffa TaxID=183260 RepID=A0ABR2R5K6_9ROSI